jgi:hypothetical protein
MGVDARFVRRRPLPPEVMSIKKKFAGARARTRSCPERETALK